jgi:hypothetical protein
MTLAAASTGSSAGGAVLAIVFVIFGVAAYWAPTLVAWLRHVPNVGSVAVIDGLLGWTVIGWIVALAMACRDTRPQQIAVVPYAPVPQPPPQAPQLPPFDAGPGRPFS